MLTDRAHIGGRSIIVVTHNELRMGIIRHITYFKHLIYCRTIATILANLLLRCGIHQL